MSKYLKLLGFIALAAVIVFSMASCDSGTTGLGGGGEAEPGLAVYSGRHSTNDLTLTISEKKTGKAVYDPKNGDSYKMLVGDKLSSGNVTDVEKTETTLKFTLKPSRGDTFTVTITISTSKITNVTGTVTFDSEGETPWAGPGNVNNGSSGGGGGGGGGRGTGGITAPSVAVTGVSLNKTSITLIIGGEEALTATIAPSNATNQKLTWSSSNASIAEVSEGGVVTAVATGKATITVTTVDGGKKAECSVTVNPIPVSGVTLKASTSLLVGGTETLEADIDPPNATNKNVTWSTSKASVATVSASGVVTGVSAGTATITVKTADGDKTAVCNVNVVTTPVAVSGVSLNKSSFSLDVGGMENLDATITPSAATNQNVTWSSNNTSVATVSESGVVTAVAPGKATITVKTQDGNKTATCAVTVNTIQVTGVSMNKSSTSLDIGGTETLYANISPANATNKNVTWSSSNTSVATVSSDGTVIAVARGTATITVKTADGGKTASCNVTVIIPTFTTVTAFNAWLLAQPWNTINTPYVVALNLSSLEGLGNVLYNNRSDKYVNLDFSGSTFTSIENYAFCFTIRHGDGSIGINYCYNLINVTIPNSVNSIESEGFAHCENLTAINVGTGNNSYTSDNGVLYNKNKTSLVQYPAGKTGSSFIIPNSVTSIGDAAFRGCIDLTSVTIPNSVTSMEVGVFANCIGLSNVIIPSSITSIEIRTFYGCTSLTNVIIPNSVTSIKYRAFYGCTSLTSITIPNNVNEIKWQAFDACTGLISVKFEGKITSDKFDYDAFPGALSYRYIENGTGTYTRPNGSSNTWTKR